MTQAGHNAPVDRTQNLVGQSVPRTEDLALMTGTARYIDDIKLPGMLYAKILRSPHAHAIFTVDVSAARDMPGVHGVLTGADIAGQVKPWGDMMQDLLVGDHSAFAVDQIPGARRARGDPRRVSGAAGGDQRREGDPARRAAAA